LVEQHWGEIKAIVVSAIVLYRKLHAAGAI
jgi:hypothetical protein